MVYCKKKAIQNAKAAFEKLPIGDPKLQQCIIETKTIPEVLESLRTQHGRFQGGRIRRIAQKFREHIMWLQNISGFGLNPLLQIGVTIRLWNDRNDYFLYTDPLAAEKP